MVYGAGGTLSGYSDAQPCREGETIETPAAHWATLGDQDQQEGIAIAAGCQPLHAQVKRGVLTLIGNGPGPSPLGPAPNR